MKNCKKLFLVFVFIVSLLLTNCGTEKSSHLDPFYLKGSEWDHLRFPLIKPYYAIYISDTYKWQIPLQESPYSRDFYYYLTIQDVQKIAVENGVIMINTSYHENVDESIGQKVLYWFVFIPEEKIEMGFDTENAFHNYINQYGISSPSWKEPNSILNEYEENFCLDWIPNCD